MCDVLWSVFGKLCSAVHRVLYSRQNKWSVGVVVNGVHLASCRVAGSNLGCGNF